MANEVKCPRCGSSSISANKKGFSAGKALAGDLIAGPVGLLAGGIGSNKLIITCLSCGHKFKPGDNTKNQGTHIINNRIALLKSKEENGTISEIEKKELDATLKTKRNGQIIAGVIILLLCLFMLKACT